MDGGSGKARELSRAHQRAVNSRGDENILSAFKAIQHMGEGISLSRLVIDSAKQLFKKVEDNKLLKGKSAEASQAACIYIACREHNVTRTFKEVCNLTKVSKKEIGRCFKLLQPYFETKTQINLDAYISRFASNLDIDAQVRRVTLIVLFIDQGCRQDNGPRDTCGQIANITGRLVPIPRLLSVKRPQICKIDIRGGRVHRRHPQKLLPTIARRHCRIGQRLEYAKRARSASHGLIIKNNIIILIVEIIDIVINEHVVLYFSLDITNRCGLLRLLDNIGFKLVQYTEKLRIILLYVNLRMRFWLYRI